jgi:four helix bundle protein
MPPDSDSPLMPHGGYENLRSYAVAEAVYDATVVFCDRFIDKSSRTHDQMVQAARSGVRNISEGSGAAATSKKMEMKLTNVARASLNDELAKDYKSFLIQRGLRVWHKSSKQCLAMRERLKHDVFPNLPASPKGKVVLHTTPEHEPPRGSVTRTFLRHRIAHEGTAWRSGNLMGPVGHANPQGALAQGSAPLGCFE